MSFADVLKKIEKVTETVLEDVDVVAKEVDPFLPDPIKTDVELGEKIVEAVDAGLHKIDGTAPSAPSSPAPPVSPGAGS
jgi:hypothetical protein